MKTIYFLIFLMLPLLSISQDDMCHCVEYVKIKENFGKEKKIQYVLLGNRIMDVSTCRELIYDPLNNYSHTPEINLTLQHYLGTTNATSLVNNKTQEPESGEDVEHTYVLLGISRNIGPTVLGRRDIQEFNVSLSEFRKNVEIEILEELRNIPEELLTDDLIKKLKVNLELFIKNEGKATTNDN